MASSRPHGAQELICIKLPENRDSNSSSGRTKQRVEANSKRMVKFPHLRPTRNRRRIKMKTQQVGGQQTATFDTTREVNPRNLTFAIHCQQGQRQRHKNHRPASQTRHAHLSKRSDNRKMPNALILLISGALIALGSPQFQLLVLGEQTNLSHQKATQSLSLALQADRSGNRAGDNDPLLSMVGSALARQFKAAASHFRDRWVHLPSEPPSSASSYSHSHSSSSRRPLLNLRDRSRFPGLPPARVTPSATRRNRVMRALNRLWARMGARNSIRVHNAFRDFAWRVLSTLSMPTPVIYELRRQHFYPADEDELQDKYFNRNTSRTIRTRRDLIELARPNNSQAARARQDADDDSEPENLRERLRLRLEDLLSLSRRSLFGRVVRLPALFPFKRQEADRDDEREHEKPGGRWTGRPPALRQRLAGRRKRKEAERQMITINGKQYYVNDEGELKEMPPAHEQS